MKITVRQLNGGDVLAGSGAHIHRVITNGLYERNADDSRSRRPWVAGKVEVLVSYPGEDAPSVRYWNARTVVTLVAKSADRRIA
jgi:hypothetical protein